MKTKSKCSMTSNWCRFPHFSRPSPFKEIFIMSPHGKCLNLVFITAVWTCSRLIIINSNINNHFIRLCMVVFTMTTLSKNLYLQLRVYWSSCEWPFFVLLNLFSLFGRFVQFFIFITNTQHFDQLLRYHRSSGPFCACNKLTTSD